MLFDVVAAITEGVGGEGGIFGGGDCIVVKQLAPRVVGVIAAYAVGVDYSYDIALKILRISVYRAIVDEMRRIACCVVEIIYVIAAPGFGYQ